ncbi:MAG: NFACT family protein [Oscillospiraceae bacterium]|nr:NFACT family protein [Oscillospiraceae bacterium]
MPLDGVTIHFLRGELACAIGSRIEKIHQPERHSLVLTLGGRGFSKRLFICARSDAPRVHFTDAPPQNPPSPPMFCMLLRKHLTGARLVDISQIGLDRVLLFDFAATNELGDPMNLTLSVELIPGRTNIVLVHNNTVLDAIRRVYPEMDERGKTARDVLPNSPYILPESPKKLRIFDVTEGTVSTDFEGVSPLLARENISVSALQKAMENSAQPTLLRNKDGTVRDFHALPIGQYGQLYTLEAYGDISSLLRDFFAQREDNTRQIDAGLRQSLERLIARTRRRLESQRMDMEKSQEREKFRHWGDLIMAQQYKLSARCAFYELEDYLTGESVRVPADPRLSPSVNAQKYYKKYQKLRNAQEILAQQIAKGGADLEYLENTRDALARAVTAGEIDALRQELIAEGFLLRRKEKGRQPKGKNAPKNPPLHSVEYEGFTILVGKTAAQNERIAFKESRKGDLWLHAQKVAGAHVLIRAEGRSVPPEVIEYAAALAVKNSAARASGKAAVDIVQAKKLKKPANSRPGMVIYHEYETIMSCEVN